MGSVGAWLRAFLKRDQRVNNAALRGKLLRMSVKVPKASSREELDRMVSEGEQFLSDTLHSFEDGAIDEGELLVFQVMFTRFVNAALQRRSDLGVGSANN